MDTAGTVVTFDGAGLRCDRTVVVCVSADADNGGVAAGLVHFIFTLGEMTKLTVPRLPYAYAAAFVDFDDSANTEVGAAVDAVLAGLTTLAQWPAAAQALSALPLTLTVAPFQRSTENVVAVGGNVNFKGASLGLVFGAEGEIDGVPVVAESVAVDIDYNGAFWPYLKRYSKATGTALPTLEQKAFLSLGSRSTLLKLGWVGEVPFDYTATFALADGTPLAQPTVPVSGMTAELAVGPGLLPRTACVESWPVLWDRPETGAPVVLILVLLTLDNHLFNSILISPLEQPVIYRSLQNKSHEKMKLQWLAFYYCADGSCSAIEGVVGESTVKSLALVVLPPSPASPQSSQWSPFSPFSTTASAAAQAFVAP